MPQFTSLSTGIGLGALRTVDQPKKVRERRPLPPEGRGVTHVGQGLDAQERKNLSPRSVGSSKTLPKSRQKKLSSPGTRKDRRPFISPWRTPFIYFEKFMIACGVDFIFVFFNLFIAFSCVTLLAYYQGEKGANILDLYPFVWLESQSILRLVGCVIAVYLVYVLAFLLIVGSTIGAMSLRTSTSHRP